MAARLPLSVLPALALSGCAGGDRPDAFTVADSAGVRVAMSADAPHEFAAIDPEPLLSLGGPNATGPTQFSTLQGAHVDAAGNLWVVDGTSAEVRLFRRDGTHWKSVGRRGDGPGEFQRPRLLGPFHGDSMAVWDLGSGRLTILDDTGGLGRTVTARSGEESPPLPYGIFEDGTLLAVAPRILPAGAVAPGSVLSEPTQLVRFDLERMSSEPIAEREGARWLWTGRYQVPIPFTVNPGLSREGNATHVAAGPDFRIRVFEEGLLTEIYGVDRAPREVTGADVAAYTGYLERVVPDSVRRTAHLSALEHPDRPRLLPAYSEVLVAADGHVWARVYAADPLARAAWDVYDQSRRWVGQVRTPERFLLTGVPDGKIVGIWLDEWGVEHVRLYPIRRQP